MDPTSTEVDSYQPDTRKAPQRVLIISASMGEGHNATGKALSEAAGRLWPAARVRWVDVLNEMGYGSGPLFRWIYETSVRRLPGLYEFFYGRVWRYRWFARASKRVIGAWSGRKLGPVIDSAAPDMVLSTYPMATTGLEWLRQHRGLSVPTGAWVSDFAPHPSWVHAGVDINLVMHDVAVPPARRNVPDAAVAVSAPPVLERFRRGDRLSARRQWGFAEQGLLAVVSCGSLGFGSASRTVRELLDGAPDMRIVVVAGHNEGLHSRLDRELGGNHQVTVLGWTDDMPTLMTAADVVVTNAGGATFLEAMACGRTVLMHNPIAGHGRANAELMAEAGLARVCSGEGSLAAAARDIRAAPETLADSEKAIATHLESHRLEDGLRAVHASTPPSRARTLRPEDALFTHVQTAAVPQQVGTVLVFDRPSGGPAPSRERAVDLLSGVPGVTGSVRPGAVLHAPRWRPNRTAAVSQLVDKVELGPSETLDSAVDAFFSVPLDAGRACGAARLVTGLPDGGRAILVKLHHSLGDGITVLRALLSEADDPGRSWATPPVSPVGRGPHPRPKRLVRGLWNMARAGTAPAFPTTGAITSSSRHHERLSLPVRRLKNTARELDVTSSELLHAVFAEAVNRVFAPAGPDRIRLMIPWSLRGTSSLRAAGNSAGALSADLPVGPMSPRQRVHEVAEAVRECSDGGMPEVAGAVVRTLGHLPGPLNHIASRLVYRSTWFNAIGTVLPGPRWQVRVQQTPLRAAYPVLPLAPGVGLSWGAMTWGESVTVCFTVAGPLGTAGTALAAETERAFDELATLVGQ